MKAMDILREDEKFGFLHAITVRTPISRFRYMWILWKRVAIGWCYIYAIGKDAVPELITQNSESLCITR